MMMDRKISWFWRQQITQKSRSLLDLQMKEVRWESGIGGGMGARNIEMVEIVTLGH